MIKENKKENIGMQPVKEETAEEKDGADDKADSKLNAFTGLLQKEGRTQNTILQAFLMNGDFIVFITVDEDSKVYIEPFSSADELEPICEALELCNIS